MKQYKLQELVGNTKKLPKAEGLFYETLISFRKLPECAQLFLPLQIQAHLRLKRQHNSSRTGSDDYKNDVKRQCSKEEEEVQSYSEWKLFISWIKLSSIKQFRRLRKSIIYILPIGPFPKNLLTSLVSPQVAFLQSLVNFGEAFFPGIKFKMLPEIEYEEIGCKTRIHSRTGHLQLLLPDVMLYLSKVLPKNSIGIIGLSWLDFFPGDEWDHILGEGSVHNGCAAISFGHYAMASDQKTSNILISPGRNDSGFYPSASSEPTEVTTTTTSSAMPRFERNHVSKSFRSKRFKSVMAETNRQRATSCTDLSMPRSSSYSSIGCPLTTSSRSYKNFGSLASIDNSWTRVFSGSSHEVSSHNSSSSSFAVDDASYDIINKEEAEMYCVSHGLEEDVVQLAIPVGCTFSMSCRIMWRLFKAISHEVGHIFGLSHCNFYECAMNSSSFVFEVDEQPLFLCPICLRKVQKFLKFKLLERYRRIRDVLKSMAPCYVEEITVSRENFDLVSESEKIYNESEFDPSIDSVYDILSSAQEARPSGHICIEVTREKSEGYDIINVEYTESSNGRTTNKEHECQFAEALGQLDDIVKFLNRH